jgi:hypothetical protein
MLYEIIEKYWSDILKQNIWDWLGIHRTSWSQFKKNGLSDKQLTKIKNYFDASDLNEKQLILHIVNKYNSVT